MPKHQRQNSADYMNDLISIWYVLCILYCVYLGVDAYVCKLCIHIYLLVLNILVQLKWIIIFDGLKEKRMTVSINDAVV